MIKEYKTNKKKKSFFSLDIDTVINFPKYHVDIPQESLRFAFYLDILRLSGWVKSLCLYFVELPLSTLLFLLSG